MKKLLSLILCLLLVVPQTVTPILSTSVEATASDSELVSIEPTIDVLELTYGIDSVYYTATTGSEHEAYCYFPFKELGLEYVFNYADGTSEIVNTDDLEYNDFQYPIAQNKDEELTPGKYAVPFEYNGITCELPVVILESPVESIEILGTVPMVEYEDSYTEYEWTENGDVEYECYDEQYAIESFAVYYKDGTSEILSIHDLDFAQYGVDSVQGYDCQWTPGNSYPAIFNYGGVSCGFEVEIVPNPISHIEVIETKPMREFLDGYYNHSYDEYGEYYRYYEYDVIDAIETVRIYYNDGTYEDHDMDYFWDFGFGYYAGNQSENPVFAGDTIETYLEWNSFRDEFTVEIVESGVVDFDVEYESQYLEKTGGSYTSEWSGGTLIGEYYSYYPEETLGAATVYFEDGTQEHFDNFYYSHYDYEYNQSYENQWLAGNTYYMSVSLGGITKELPVTIVETSIESLQLNGVFDVVENTHGYVDHQFDYELGETVPYFYYSYGYFIDSVTINYKDGTSETVYLYDIEDYNIYADQDYYNQWLVGGQYPLTLTYQGVSATVYINIIETPVDYIEYNGNFDLWENSDGYTAWGYDENGNRIEYFRYYAEECLESITVYYKDGNAETIFREDLHNYYYSMDNNQSGENQWTVGNSYTVDFSFEGYEDGFTVNIVENPIADIIPVGDFDIIAGTSGYWCSQRSESGEYVTYYYYEWEDLLSGFDVYYNDGSSEYVDIDDISYSDVDFFDVPVQSADALWGPGCTYTIGFNYLGFEDKIEINIHNSGIVSMVPVGNFEVAQFTGGYMNSAYVPELDDYDEYYYYPVMNHIEYFEVTYEDGYVVNVDYLHDEMTCDYEQDYYNQWTAGNSYRIVVRYRDAVCEFEFSVTETNIASIEVVGDFDYVENTHGWWHSYIDDNGDVHEYYIYSFMQGFEELIVNYKDGTSERYCPEYRDLGIEGDWQGEGSIWTVGNTYPITINYKGVTTTVNINIVENPVASIEAIGDKDIIEGTNGYWETYGYYDEEGNYLEEDYFLYYYNVGVNKVRVNYKDGHSEEHYFADLDDCYIERPEHNYHNQWSAGNSYDCTLNYMGITCEYTINILESNIASIEAVGNFDYAECTHGGWNYGYNEYGERVEYFDYSVMSGLDYFRITYTDGSVEERFIEGDGLRVEFEQDADNQWMPGNSYPVTVYYCGAECTYYINITENPIAYISVEGSFEVVEGTNGWWTWDWDWETDSRTPEYFHYNNDIGIDCVVINYKDGRIERVSLESIDSYNLYSVDSQNYYNQWSAGRSYEFVLECYGYTCIYSVSIIETDVVSIEPIGDLDYEEFTNGSFEYEYVDGIGEVKYFFYYPNSGVDFFRITYKDGHFEDGWFGEAMRFEYEQDYENQWSVGGTYPVTVSYRGATFTYYINIVESNIKSIEAKGEFDIVEGTESHKEPYFDENGEYLGDYNVYYSNAGLEYIVVNYKDGTSEELGLWEIDYDSHTEDQSYENRWTAGNSYEITVTYKGISCTYTVNIIESPVESIEVFGDFDIVEHTHGYWEWGYFDGEEVNYFIYQPSDLINNVKINYKDGTSETKELWQLDRYSISYVGGQSAYNPWTVGNSYEVVLNYLGANGSFFVNIVEDPVERIEIYSTRPLVYRHDSNTRYDYDEFGNEYEYEYFYAAAAITELKLYYKDGTTNIISVQDYEGEISYSSDQTYSNQWLPGNKYTASVYINNVEYEIEVSIVEPSQFDYIVESDGIYIIGWESYNSSEHTEDVVIPSEIHGMPVVGIYYLGERMLDINTITIPDSVKFIGNYAFEWCFGVKEINIGSGAEVIDPTAFLGGGTGNLNAINVSEDNKYFTSVDGVLFNANVSEFIAYPAAKGSTYEMPLTIEKFENIQLYPNVEFIFSPDSDLFVTENGVTYNKDKTAIISTDKTVSGDYVMPETVEVIFRGAFRGCDDLTGVVISPNVTNIAYATFDNCPNLASVILPEKLVSIENYAFSDCAALKSIDFNGELLEIWEKAFYRSGLKSIVIPDNVMWIGEECFVETQAETLEVGSGLDYIPYAAFSNNAKLRTVALSEGLMAIERSAFAYCESLTDINIPDTTTYFGNSIFAGCTSLEFVPLGANQPWIPGEYMLGCTSLVNAVLTDNITEIGWNAFENCTSLKTINIPDSVTYFDEEIFRNCDSLEYIPIGKNQFSITNGEFDSCDGLVNIEIPEHIEHIGDRAFRNCSKLEAIELHDNIKYIGSSVFENCVSLKKAVVGNSIKEIAMSAFANSGLEKVEIGGNVELIDSAAFYRTQLSSVEIPASVTSISYLAFYGCENLSDIKMPDTLVAIGAHAFDETKWLDEQSEGAVYLGTSLYTYKGDISEDKTVYIKDGTLSISSHAFEAYCEMGYGYGYDRSGLKAVYIPADMQLICSGAFSGCENLETVYYAGTEEQWSQIDIHGGNSELLNCDIVFGYEIGDAVFASVIVDGFATYYEIGSTVTLRTGKFMDDEMGRIHVFTGWTVEGVEIEDTTSNEISFVVPAHDVIVTKNTYIHGDVNGDGVISAIDVYSLLRVIKGVEADTPGSDVDMNGRLNAVDILTLRKVIKGVYEYPED